jgi:hypothetical protein
MCNELSLMIPTIQGMNVSLYEILLILTKDRTEIRDISKYTEPKKKVKQLVMFN